MIEFSGWIGAVLFAICAFPQAIQCARDGHAKGLNWFFLVAWFFGEIFTLVYIIPKQDFPLIANYSVNLVFLIIILRYKIWGRK